MDLTYSLLAILSTIGYYCISYVRRWWALVDWRHSKCLWYDIYDVPPPMQRRSVLNNAITLVIFAVFDLKIWHSLTDELSKPVSKWQKWNRAVRKCLLILRSLRFSRLNPRISLLFINSNKLISIMYSHSQYYFCPISILPPQPIQLNV